MTILVKNATILNELSSWNGKKADVFINRGKIEKIGKGIKTEAKEVISGPNLYISNSWVDIGCRINEPGYEQRETLNQLVDCARRGGYGVIAPFPNTQPIIDNKSAIENIIRAGKDKNITIIPIGSVSVGAKGNDMAELIDMSNAGCYIFSDGINGIQKNDLLLRSLQYIKSFGGVVINTPFDNELSNHGLIHEGKISTLIGTRGIPSMAEFTTIDKQIAITEYSNSSLCLFGLSTKEGVKSIRKHKSKKALITSIVSYLNLVFTDEDLSSFNVNLKVKPPLREKEDQNELIKGLIDGTIQAISSNHTPYDEESKDLEFEYAKFGASGIETVFAALNTFCKKLPLKVIINALTTGPRAILKLENTKIEEGEKADLTIFNNSEEWQFDESLSSSKNNPFQNQTLTGKVIKTIV